MIDDRSLMIDDGNYNGNYDRNYGNVQAHVKQCGMKSSGKSQKIREIYGPEKLFPAFGPRIM